MYLPSLDPETLFCIILYFSQKKSDGLKKKSRYRLSSSEHVKRQKLREMLELWPPAHHLNPLQLSVSAVASSLPELCQARVVVGGCYLLTVTGNLNQTMMRGHHSCQPGSSQEGLLSGSQCLSDQVLTAHLGPRPSPQP